MEEEYEESALSIVRGRKGCDDHYHDKISKFKEHLNEIDLAEERVEFGWVFWSSNHTTQLQNKIITLFKHIVSHPIYCFHYLVQFWAVVKVEEAGQIHHLSTSHQPFSVGNPTTGLCWYRKLCTDHVYVVDNQEQLGSVGRAYRNKHPESTPDLRLYSANEYPMRDEAARCCLRGYLALPLFDLHTNECYGVIELVSGTTIGEDQLSSLNEGLQVIFALHKD